MPSPANATIKDSQNEEELKILDGGGYLHNTSSIESLDKLLV